MRSAIATASALSSSARPHVPSSRRGPGEAREQPHPDRAVSFGKRSERLVQQRDDLRVGSGAHPHEAPAVADRGPRELLGVVAMLRARSAASRNVAFATSVSPARLCASPSARSSSIRSVSSGAPRQRRGAPCAKRRAPSSYASCCTARSPASRAYVTARSTGPTGRLAQQCLASSASRGPRSRPRSTSSVRPASSWRRRRRNDGISWYSASDITACREAQVTRTARAVDDDGDRRRLVEGGRRHRRRRPRARSSTSSGKSRPSTDASSSTRWQRFGQLAQPPQHGLTHVARDEQAIRLEGLVEPSFGREQPRGLTDIERIAVCQLADLRDQP